MHERSDLALLADPAGIGHAQRPDLMTRSDVHDLVVAFYRDIVFDELLEPIFGEVAEVDWAEHIPKLIDYWCWILFGAEGYHGAVTRTHRHLHSLRPIEVEHCDRWFSLWVANVDGQWRGPNAEHATTHAAALMTGMAKRLFGFSWPRPTTAASATSAGE